MPFRGRGQYPGFQVFSILRFSPDRFSSVKFHVATILMVSVQLLNVVLLCDSLCRH